LPYQFKITNLKKHKAMNIKESTLKQIDELYSVTYYDEYINEVSPHSDKCTEINVFLEWGPAGPGNYDEAVMLSKSIRVPSKMEVTLDWLINKVNSCKTYESFAKYFAKLINRNDFNVYPTTYGIGVVRIYNFNREKDQQFIDNLLASLGIEYSNEYSNAGWVYRYKISKSATNINKIKSLI